MSCLRPQNMRIMITHEDRIDQRDKDRKALAKVKEMEKQTVVYKRIKIPGGMIEKRRKK